MQVGALWIVAPPTAPPRSPLQYAGLPLWDAAGLDGIAARLGARRMESVEDLERFSERGAVLRALEAAAVPEATLAAVAREVLRALGGVA